MNQCHFRYCLTIKTNEYIWKEGSQAFECGWYIQKFVRYYVIPLWKMVCDMLAMWKVSSVSFLVLSDNPLTHAVVS
jgi:hypothetical protein